MHVAMLRVICWAVVVITIGVAVGPAGETAPGGPMLGLALGAALAVALLATGRK